MDDYRFGRKEMEGEGNSGIDGSGNRRGFGTGILY
jgi:hypothetical protein